jgi:transposase
MPAPTSTELRERIVRWFYDFNLPVEEIVCLSGRSRTTIYQILHLYDTFGQVTNTR